MGNKKLDQTERTESKVSFFRLLIALFFGTSFFVASASYLIESPNKYGLWLVLFQLLIFYYTLILLPRNSKASTTGKVLIVGTAIFLLGLPNVILSALSGDELAIVISLFIIGPIFLITSIVILPFSLLIIKRGSIVSMVGAIFVGIFFLAYSYGLAAESREINEAKRSRDIQLLSNLNERIEECNKLKSQRQSCLDYSYLREYKATEDQSYCFKIKDQTYTQYECFVSLAQKNRDISYCEHLKFAQHHKNCITVVNKLLTGSEN